MSQYMQDSPTSSSHYIPGYNYPTGNEETGSHSPTSSSVASAALVAYYGSASAASMGSHADYASYYNNYMAAAAGSLYGSSGNTFTRGGERVYQGTLFTHSQDFKDCIFGPFWFFAFVPPASYWKNLKERD